MKKIILLSSVLFIGAVSFMMATSTTSEQAAPAPQTVVQLEPSADQPSESMQPISVVDNLFSMDLLTARVIPAMTLKQCF